MAAYQARRYTPGNLVLTLAGQVDWERTLEQVQALTAGWPKGEASRAYPEVKARVGEMREPIPKPPRPIWRCWPQGFGPGSAPLCG